MKTRTQILIKDIQKEEFEWKNTTENKYKQNKDIDEIHQERKGRGEACTNTTQTKNVDEM